MLSFWHILLIYNKITPQFSRLKEETDYLTQFLVSRNLSSFAQWFMKLYASCWLGLQTVKAYLGLEALPGSLSDTLTFPLGWPQRGFPESE